MSDKKPIPVYYTIPAKMHNKRYTGLIFILFFITVQQIIAGPPFDTDDPETVRHKHWEYYISTLNSSQFSSWSGTSPHIDINYGLLENLQIHLIMPMNYSYSPPSRAKFGYADTEIGAKYRFVQETENSPQIGVFPIVEVPTFKNSEFSDGTVKVFLPVWAQKSFGKFTTYGGAGYWINPGKDNKNWIFAGWEVLYDFSELLTLGGEVYYHSSDTKTSKSGAGFNVGGSVNLSAKFHIIFSAGHSISNNNNMFSSYFGLLWTI
jgi:hypothetical protein